MISSRLLLTTSKVLTLETETSVATTREDILPPCSLKWRQKKLWVKPAYQAQTFILPALESNQWLLDCLKRSPVKYVCIDPKLGETGIRGWADICKRASKKVFLRLPAYRKLLESKNSVCWRIKRSMDWIAAALLLLLLSPIMLGLAGAIKISSPGSVFFRQWRVGRRGKLFQIIKFRTMVVEAESQHHEVMGEQLGLHKRQDDPRITPIGRWLRQYSLDELPQLFNVLRGEMSLVGPRPWALYDALRLGNASKQRLNALPGMTGPWQVEARSNLLDLEVVSKWDLDYLCNWSLGKDLKILLMTIPRVISGFGAY